MGRSGVAIFAVLAPVLTMHTNGKMNQSLKNKILNKKTELQKNRGEKKMLKGGMKLCPFQSNPNEEVACSPRCVLYRSSKQAGYECPLSEFTSMSWLLRQDYDSKVKRGEITPPPQRYQQ